jgi:allantoinase
MNPLQTLVKNVTVIRPDTGAENGERLDLGVADGRFARIEPDIPEGEADDVVDGRGLLAFPGVVDAHQHWGIYNPLSDDTATESRSSAQGGVTTGLTYMRTGQYYLNSSGPYREFFPKVLAAAEGRSHIDYAFHLAPMSKQHIDEIPSIITDLGVTSFKIFMFYGGHGLHGASSDQSSFLMIPPDERYDLAHFEFVMRGIAEAREKLTDLAPHVSLSLHCETAEIMTAYTKLVQADGSLQGLAAYSASRPPHSEALAVTIASFLADETGLPSINLLHLSSRKALDAALRMAKAFPHVDFRREVTIGHLLADIDTAHGLGGKVNPPLRGREDVEALWEHVLVGDVDWVVSDHACCKDEQKFGDPRDDIFAAKSGFGGAEYLLPGLVSEGHRRGLSYRKIAEMTSWAPARRYGLPAKGTIGVGYDADFCLVDPSATWTVHAAESFSSQEYSPFEGFELGARVTDTWIRGTRVLDGGNIVGQPVGQHLRRPGRQVSGPPPGPKANTH